MTDETSVQPIQILILYQILGVSHTQKIPLQQHTLFCYELIWYRGL